MAKDTQTQYRLFLSIPIAPTDVPALQTMIRPYMQKMPELRWLSVDTWHITLAYVGECSAAVKEQIIKIMQQNIHYGAGDLLAQVAGWVQWPVANPRVLALQLRVNPELLQLRQSLVSSLAAVGINVDQNEFIPHITVARLGSDYSCNLQKYKAKAVEVHIKAIELWHSNPGPAGSTYESVYSCAVI